MSVIKLTSEQFDGSLLPIFQAVKAEVVGARFDANYFFPTWRDWMNRGIAHTFHLPGVVLGATLTPCVFSGEVQAHVVFWFALPKVRRTGAPKQVFQAFEQYATGSGAKVIYAAAYKGLNYSDRVAGYSKNGFNNIESTFRKRL